jgi:NADH dehydrogenase (ubiquinone) Fe-S protein 1
MNSRITAIDDADLLLVIGSNVRVDAPVLNARIRRNQKQGLDVFTIGPSPDLGYNYEHVGSTT